MTTRPGETTRRLCFYGLLVLCTVLLPLVLDMPFMSPFVGATFKTRKLLELFGLSGFLAVVFALAWEVRQRRPGDLLGWMSLLLPAGIALHWLGILTERTLKDWDYVCYEGAAQLLLNGQNPYLECYVYPPLPVVVFSRVYSLIQESAIALVGSPLQHDSAWMAIFYLYQSAQWFLVVLAYVLTHRLARAYGLSSGIALSAVTVLFVLNNPLLRTIHWFQINLWVLNAVLLVLLHHARHPFTAGLLAAVGAHIKIYPGLFVAPWALLRSWKALAGFAVGAAALALLVTGPSFDVTIWEQFLDKDPTRVGGQALRDNSFRSLTYNLLRVTKVIGAEDFGSRAQQVLVAGFTLMAGLWFLARSAVRYRWMRELRRSGVDDGREPHGLLADTVAWMLLMSPVAWEHHFVLAIPVALRTFSLEIADERPPVFSLVGFALVFALPTFDVFPMSYLRLAGLLVLLVGSDPMLRARRLSGSATFGANGG